MYDHHKKAGNQGDVVKHPALVAAVDGILEHAHGGAFRVFDTFAGYAHNPIVKGNEWQNGIGHIHRLGRETDNPHVNAWMAQWRVGTQLLGNVYPGSSVFVLKTCQSRNVSFRASLWDTSPTVIAQLMTVYAKLDIQIHGRAATPSDVRNNSPDFLFIDPPGIRSSKNPDYPRLEDLTEFLDGEHHVLIWLPLVADISVRPPPESDNSQNWRTTFTNHGLSATTVRWTPGGPICGCQLFYRLPSKSTLAMRQAVAATVALTDWNMNTVEHFGET